VHENIVLLTCGAELFSNTVLDVAYVGNKVKDSVLLADPFRLNLSVDLLEAFITKFVHFLKSSRQRMLGA